MQEVGAADVTATFRFWGSELRGNVQVMEQLFVCSAWSLISGDFSCLISSISPQSR